MLMRERERNRRLRRQAHQLAETGRYSDWKAVEAALVDRVGATSAISDWISRIMLDRTCAHARRPKAAANG